MAVLGELNWLAVLASVIFGQVFLTIWFLPLFGESWAREYGAADKAAHAKEIPGVTYALGLACTLAVVLGLAGLKAALGVAGLGEMLGLGLVVALCFAVATALPGYAFLRRWGAFRLAIGAQVGMILGVSVILGLMG